jgi:hypothetical protein
MTKLNSQDHSSDPTLAELLAKTKDYNKEVSPGLIQVLPASRPEYFHVKDYVVSSSSCGFLYLIARISPMGFYENLALAKA